MKKNKTKGAGKWGSTIGIKELEEAGEQSRRARRIQMDGEELGGVFVTMIAMNFGSMDDVGVAAIALAKAYGELKAVAEKFGIDVEVMFRQETVTFERAKREEIKDLKL